MQPLERRYRRLMFAYPSAYRQEREDEIVGTLLDVGEDDRRWPTPTEAADLVLNGWRTRARSATGATTAGLWVESLGLAAVMGVTVMAGVSIAMLWFLAMHGTSFYALYIGPNPPGQTNVGFLLYALQHLLWPVALMALVAGRRRIVLPVVVVAALAATVTFVFHTMSSIGLGLVRFGSLDVMVAMTALAFVPALCVLCAAFLRSDFPTSRSTWWAAVAAALSVLFVLAGDGLAGLAGSNGGAVAFLFPGDANGVVPVLIALWIFAAGSSLLAAPLDPRVPLAVAFLTVPVTLLLASSESGLLWYYLDGGARMTAIAASAFGIIALLAAAHLGFRRLNEPVTER